MKKLLILGLMLASIFIGAQNVSASTADELDTSDEISEFDIELQKMREVFLAHYYIDCNSKESRQQFKDNNDLKEIYDEMCKVEVDDKIVSTADEDLYINENIELVKSFIEYDLENDQFYLELISKLNQGILSNDEVELLELSRFYFENDFEISPVIVEEIVEIVYSETNSIMLLAVSYGNWYEYDRDYNYAMQWVSSSLYNVDKVFERRVVYDYTDWTYVGVTTCKTIKPADTEFTMYVRYESCGFLNLGSTWKVYTRETDNYFEYHTSYEVTSKIDDLPDIDDEGREKFHLTKKLYYDYLLVPYKSDLEGAEVDIYLNYARYHSEQDNFLTSKSLGAYFGDSEQTLKVRGKITGNYVGSRYLYKYTYFEFRDGRVEDCSNSACFSSSYYNDLNDEFLDIFSFTTAEEVLHTLITNFLFYKSDLGSLYVSTNDYPYVYYGYYVEYSSLWINYLSELNDYAALVTMDRNLKIYEHYFRNKIQEDQFPDDLDDFVSLNNTIIPSQRWYVYDVEDAIYHMNDFDRSQGGIISESEKGAYNIKLGSYNDYFELVYSTYYGTALTEEVDWVNMGTYNFDGDNALMHFTLDMTPYKYFGNCGHDEADGFFSLVVDGWNTVFQNHPNYIAYLNNQNAIDKYNYYKDLIE
ncbi:MAG: hypothetical protein ACLFRI_05565 [Candidatus Izemoplasmataceae bacterium]